MQQRVGLDGADARKELEEFEAILLARLAAVGLPNDVLADVAQRGLLLESVPESVAELDAAALARGAYVSKLIAAAAVGLFDAALNYLWDATVGELRRRVAAYDLAYFFEVAVSSPERRRRFTVADDLRWIDDIDLLRAARQVGLITHDAHLRLDHVRVMRNQASAAHPSVATVTGADLAQWLAVSIRDVVAAPVDPVTARIGTLLAEMRDHPLSIAERDAAAAFFHGLPQDRVDALAAGLLGLYVDAAASALSRDNVLALWPALWPCVSEPRRHELGTKYTRLAAEHPERAGAARVILDCVDSAAYLPTSMRAAEIDAALDALLTAERAGTDASAAGRALRHLVSDGDDVPQQVLDRYTAALVELYVNGDDGLAADLLAKLTPEQAGRALRAVGSPPVAAALNQPRAQDRWAQLLRDLEPRLGSHRNQELLQAIRAHAGSPATLAQDPHVARLLAPRHRAKHGAAAR
jgi:hypothetical protein